MTELRLECFFQQHELIMASVQEEVTEAAASHRSLAQLPVPKESTYAMISTRADSPTPASHDELVRSDDLDLHNTSEHSLSTDDCSWAQMMASMEEASQQYKAKGDNNKLRMMQRNRAVAATLQSLADMIPEQNGLSVLRGGLNGIFKVCTLAEKRLYFNRI